MTSETILLIDDNLHLHEIFDCFASVENRIKVDHAQSLQEGLDCLSSKLPDAIFLDNRLVPFNDFRETVPKIRAAGFEGKIVVVSVDTNHSAFNEAQEYSVHNFAEKFEFTAQNFSSKVVQLLN